MSNKSIPIACNLSALPDREQHEAIGAQLMPQAQSLTELEYGYQIVFPVDTLNLVSKFVDGERRCCPFIHFNIVVPPASDNVLFQVMGDADVKQFIKQELLPNLPVLS